MDPHRQQALLPQDVGDELAEALRPIYAACFPAAQASAWNVLKSLPGGPAQAPHRDFPVNMGDAFDFWDYTQLPGSMMLAVQDDTILHGYGGWNRIAADLKEHVLIRLNRGDVIMFRGEFIHAGAGYDTTNIRIHCFLEPPAFQHAPNTTTIVALLDPDQVRASPTVCPVCRNQYATRQGMLRHLRSWHRVYQNRRNGA
ncbi:hypothetical protein V7S43_009794 [Phytophthora oleae]|uniref:C2H2-type domain-containing protein n=1 Tax=Phytophthora oleae TaxID=2107226 RepID=A0ABD3FH30_9STRA